MKQLADGTPLVDMAIVQEGNEREVIAFIRDVHPSTVPVTDDKVRIGDLAYTVIDSIWSYDNGPQLQLVVR